MKRQTGDSGYLGSEYLSWSYDEYLQDWPSWIKYGYADVVIPQVYRYSWAEYKKALDSQHADSLGIFDSHCLIFPGMLINVGNMLSRQNCC